MASMLALARKVAVMAIQAALQLTQNLQNEQAQSVAREAPEKASRTAWERADISIKRNGTNMKLRNKKTGDTGDYLCAIQGDYIKLWSATNSYETYHYKCLSEFANEWEDYKPKKPLVEGRKQRAVLKAAARISGATTVTVRRWDTARIVIFDFAGKCRVELKDIGINIKKDGLYTITELCGDEEKKWRK